MKTSYTKICFFFVGKAVKFFITGVEKLKFFQEPNFILILKEKISINRSTHNLLGS